MAGVPDQAEMFYAPTREDDEAIEWSMTILRTLAGSSEVITQEQACRVQIPGLSSGGTADAILPKKLAHADLKTGQKRNYREQMAAYALGFMEQYFATEWTAHVLFCDQREVVTHHFTFEEAARIVGQVRDRYFDLNKKPSICSYCNWCAKANSCDARLREASRALEATSPGFNFEPILADNTRLGNFLRACAVLDVFREQAAEALKERLKAGASVAGWKLTSRKGSEYIDNVSLGLYIKELGFGPVLGAYGNLSAKKFREIWEQKMPREKPFPEHLIKAGRPSVSLCQVPLDAERGKEVANA